MRRTYSFLAVLAVAGSTISAPTPAIAKTEYGGGCMGFAGQTGGQKYSGIKCYLDSNPGAWIIRYSVMERDDADEYKALLKVPRRKFPCTFTKMAPLPGNGVINITYNIEKCG